MRKLLKLAIAATAFSLPVPLVAHATCTATGTIPRVFVQSASLTNIGVRANAPGSVFFNFTTSNTAVIAAAVTAEASHMTVSIGGAAAACGPVIGGVSAGGTVINMTVSP